MATSNDTAELRKKYEAAKTADPFERNEYTPGERTMSGVLKPEAYKNRKAAHEMLQNMREQDLEAAAARKAEGKKKGGKVSSASSRADGIAQRGKTRGTIVMCGGGMYKK